MNDWFKDTKPGEVKAEIEPSVLVSSCCYKKLQQT